MDLSAVWNCFNNGEAVYDEEGNATGMKPPLRIVEQHFQTSWRKSAVVRNILVFQFRVLIFLTGT